MAEFRETLWFKIGGLAAEAEATEAPHPLPLEDRYLDDGSVTEADIKQFSVRTPPVTPPKPQTKP